MVPPQSAWVFNLAHFGFDRKSDTRSQVSTRDSKVLPNFCSFFDNPESTLEYDKGRGAEKVAKIRDTQELAGHLGRFCKLKGRSVSGSW